MNPSDVIRQRIFKKSGGTITTSQTPPPVPIVSLNNTAFDGILLPPASSFSTNFFGQSNNCLYKADVLDTVVDVNTTVSTEGNMFDGTANTQSNLDNSATSIIRVVFNSTPEDHRASSPTYFYLAGRGFDNMTQVKFEYAIAGVYTTVFDDTTPQTTGYIAGTGTQRAYVRSIGTTNLIEELRLTIATGAGTQTTLQHYCVFSANQIDQQRMLLHRDGTTNYMTGALPVKVAPSYVLATGADVSGNVLIADRTSLGSELVTAGDFATSTGWTFNSGWTYDGTNFEADHASNGTGTLTTTVTQVVGNAYILTYQVKNRTAGTVTPAIGGVTLATQNSDGTYTHHYIATATTTLTFTPTNTARFSIDNVSVKQVTGGNLYTIGNINVGLASTPTARLQLPAGTTAASTAPLKLTTGTSMTSAEAGAVEFTTDDLFFTITTGTARKRLLMADAVGGLTSGTIPVATTNGRLADSSFTSTNITSGVYTPTRSAEANLDANVTMTQAQYMRVGSVVTVSGSFTADPTLTATSTSFEITLPVASNVGAAEDVAGTAFCGSIAGLGAMVFGVAANDTAKFQWVAGDITSQTWSYTFTYRVI